MRKKSNIVKKIIARMLICLLTIAAENGSAGQSAALMEVDAGTSDSDVIVITMANAMTTMPHRTPV